MNAADPNAAGAHPTAQGAPSVLIVGHGPVAAAVAREITAAAEGAVIVHRADGVGAADRLVSGLAGTTAGPEVVVACDSDHHSPDEVLAAVISASGPEDPPPRLLVVTSRTAVSGIGRTVDAGLLDGVVSAP
ncbi:hypothetical protein, partial [Dietzia psychralcaliphila]